MLYAAEGGGTSTPRRARTSSSSKHRERRRASRARTTHLKRRDEGPWKRQGKHFMWFGLVGTLRASFLFGYTSLFLVSGIYDVPVIHKSKNVWKLWEARPSTTIGEQEHENTMHFISAIVFVVVRRDSRTFCGVLLCSIC